MTTLFIDCPTGLAGDMLLAALLDLGVPRAVIDEPLQLIGLGEAYGLKIKEERSDGLRGLKLTVEAREGAPPLRRWQEIRDLIARAHWSDALRTRVMAVFSALAEAEAFVHGTAVEEVHFHELGAIDALVDVVGVCASIDYIKPLGIISAPPPAGRGQVKTDHGLLPVPVPAVLELARRHRIPLLGGEAYPPGELTTPTGLALVAVLASSFGQPSSMGITEIGIGLGHRRLDRPNLLRICALESSEWPRHSGDEGDPKDGEGICRQSVVVQEAWIDDATAEDLSALMDQLRCGGALEVLSAPVLMKKGRPGVAITALVRPEHAAALRRLWFMHGSTLGLRERLQERWLLPRRLGVCPTPWGDVPVKQVRRPDGRLSIKPEADALIQLSCETGRSVDELRLEVLKASAAFVTEADWSW